ncbi:MULTISPECIES: hypothetical protein [unclassified Prevotella]|uniref:hypothetical protein n=1 Tax=unclassified Prevotella TaxID=2638335 RepID=UPI00048A5987|nr:MULTISPECIES: hypothetical protein [unclassified Prevotella]
MNRSIISVVLSLVAFCGAFAQKSLTVDAEYTYRASEDVSLGQAKQTALERAKIQAIADAFGTIVSETNSMRMSNKNGRSDIDFLSISGSDVKGEWIETIGQPQYQINYDGETLVVTAKCKGRIREIVANGVDFQAKVLRNGTDDRSESETFFSGDNFYVSFTSPVAGYVAIYLVDVGNMACCLLPYQAQQDGIYSVKANQRYVFFNVDEALPTEKPIVDLYRMTTLFPVEQNQIYIVFSTQPFVKAADAVGKGQLRELKGDEFQKWLAKCRKRDTNMSVKMIPIAIKKQ